MCVTIKITNKLTNEEITVQEAQFSTSAGILADERFKIEMAFQDGDEYTTSAAHDPVAIMYDNNNFHLGTSTTFPEYLTYCLDTDESDYVCHMKRSVSPYDHVGHIKCQWTILAGENDEPEDPGDVPEIDEPGELLGKSWTGMLTIDQALDLPVMVDQAYVQYSFWSATGLETFTTLNIETVTHSPKFDYTYKHHIPVVTQEFIDYLKKPMYFYLHVSPYAKTSGLQPISTSNATIAKNLGYVASAKDDPSAKINELMHENEFLKHLCEEKDKEIHRLKAELFGYTKEDSDSSARKKLASAKEMDAAVDSMPSGDAAGS